MNIIIPSLCQVQNVIKDYVKKNKKKKEENNNKLLFLSTQMC
jgi:hypothetical protein